VYRGDLGQARSETYRQKGKPAGDPSPQIIYKRALGRGTALKTATTLIVLLFLSTTFAGSVRDVPIARTTAAPSPFGPPVMVNDNTAGEQSAPIVTAVNGNELFAVWQDSRISTAWSSIYCSRSFNNGTTWAPNKRVDDPIFNSSTPKETAVAVSRNGTILTTWQDNRRNTFDYDIFFAKSYDGGATFKKNVKVDDSKSSPASWQERPSIAVTFAGIIYIAWTDDRTVPLRVRGAYSTDMGATFSLSKEISPAGTSGQNEVDLVANGNRIFAAFIDNTTGVNHPYVCSSSDGGKTFTNPTRLDNTGSPGKAQNGVSIAPMPSGGVVAIWADSRNGDSDIYASIVSADCQIMTSNVRVDNDSNYAYNWQEAAAVATDQLGNVYAAWQDERTSGYPAIRFAVLKAGKNQFGASVEVAKPGSTDMQLRPTVTTKNPGHVYLAWQDDKAGTSDVYLSAGYIPNLYDIALFGGWNFVSLFVANSTLKASTLGLMNGDMVSPWNSSRGVFDKPYIVGVSPPLFDFAIKQSTGYWIWAGATETLSLNGTVPTSKQSRTIAGPAGGYWAAVGFVAFNSTRRASDIPAMYSVPGGVTAVSSYNPTSGRYTTYVVGLPSTDFKVAPGQAYWCWCVASGVLSYYP
jgi:hypothetical protein